MSFVGLVILRACSDRSDAEDTCFWLLLALSRVVLPRYFSRSMAGAHLDLLVLKQLVMMRLPRVHGHLSELGLPPELVASPWIICLGCDGSLHPSAVLRMLDCLFLEGPDVLLAAALAIFRAAAPALLECDALDSAVEIVKTTARNFGDAQAFAQQARFELEGAGGSEEISRLRSRADSSLGSGSMAAWVKGERKTLAAGVAQRLEPAKLLTALCTLREMAAEGEIAVSIARLLTKLPPLASDVRRFRKTAAAICNEERDSTFSLLFDAASRFFIVSCTTRYYLCSALSLPIPSLFR